MSNTFNSVSAVFGIEDQPMEKLIPLVIDLADAFDRLQLRYAIGGAIANTGG